MADLGFEGLRVSELLTHLVGAAAAAAVLAGAQLPPRVASTLVVAAVRGGAQGAAALAAPQPSAVLGTLPVAVHLLRATTVPQALRALRSSGRPELALRMQRFSRARNGIARPDTTLLDDVHEFSQCPCPRTGSEAASCAEEANAGTFTGCGACGEPKGKGTARLPFATFVVASTSASTSTSARTGISKA